MHSYMYSIVRGLQSAASCLVLFPSVEPTRIQFIYTGFCTIQMVKLEKYQTEKYPVHFAHWLYNFVFFFLARLSHVTRSTLDILF